MSAMTTVRLVRDCVETVNPTMGRLFTDEAGYQTLELPWKDNTPRVSCVPLGTYSLVMRPSPKFHRLMPWIDGVPGRSTIEIHALNDVSETDGCVGIGYRRDGAFRLGYGARLASDEFNRWLTSALESGPVQISVEIA